MTDNSTGAATQSGVATIKQPGTAPVAPTTKNKMSLVLASESIKRKFMDALGSESATGSFIASLTDLYASDSYLAQCDCNLVILEALKAAALKLPVIKSLGFAYIVPYKKNNVQIPQMQIGYKGYIQMAMRTGQYRTINADMVYEGELQKVNKLSGEINFQGEKTSDEVIGYFAYLELLNGYSKTLYMTKEAVIKHAKKYSKSYSNASSPWQTEFDAMALKTLTRNLLSHWGYLSIEMMNAIANDNDDNLEDDRNKDVNAKGNKKNLDADDVDYEDVINKQVAKEEAAAGTAGPNY
jgi:recombination protein RecT